MSRSLDVSVLVRLVDRVTGPLRGLQRQFERLSGLARRIGVLGGAVAAISFMLPIQSAAAFDQKLRDMVVTSGHFGSAAEDQIRIISASLLDLALKVGLTTDALADASAGLASSGMDDALANRLLPTIGRVAKAASALPADVAKVGFVLSSTFGVAADDMEANFAKLMVAGKLGRFEFRDMAKVIPALSGSLKTLGVTGTEAVATLGAALQIAMLGTDSPDTAANNFKNFTDKVLAPDAVKKFQDLGVNIEGVMTNALSRGINPVEAALQKISSLTGTSQKEIDSIFNRAKGKGMTDAEAADEVKARIRSVLGRTKMGELFQDTQVLDFLVPFMLNKDKYLDFKKQIAASGLDVIAKDFATQMAGLSTQLTIFQTITKSFGDRVGAAFGSNLTWINAGLTTLLRWVQQIDAAFPGVIDQVLTFAGAGLVLVTALGLMGPVFAVLSAGVGVIAAGVAALLSPIGLLVALLVGGAAIIIANWSTFAPTFARMWESTKESFTAGKELLQRAFSGDWSGARDGGGRLLAALGDVGAGVIKVLRDTGRIATQWVDAQLGTDLTGAGDRMMSTVQAGMQDVFSGGRAAVRSLWTGDWSGLSAAVRRVLSGLTAVPRGLVSLLGSGLAAAVAQLDKRMDGIPSKAIRIGRGLGAMIGGAARAIAARVAPVVQETSSGLLAWAGGLAGQVAAALGASPELVAAGGTLLNQLWEGAKAKFNAFKAWAGGILSEVGAEFDAAARKSDDDWSRGGSALMTKILDGAQAKFSELKAWAGGIAGEIGTAITTGVTSLTAAGQDLIQQLWDGAKAKFEELRTWVMSIPGMIKAAIGNIDLSSIITWPSMPSFGFGASKPAPANDNTGAAPAGATAPQRQGWAPASEAGRNFAGASPAAMKQEPITGKIVVEAAPGTRIREASTGSGNLAMVADRGAVVGRA